MFCLLIASRAPAFFYSKKSGLGVYQCARDPGWSEYGSTETFTTEMRNVFSGTLLPLYVLEGSRKDSKPKFQTFTTSCNHTYKYKLLMMTLSVTVTLTDNGEMHSGKIMPTQLHRCGAAFTVLHDREVQSECTSVP